MHTRASVWWDLPSRPNLDAADPLIGETTCRTVIIGGGIAGWSLAAALAARGDHDIVLLERAHPAAGATGRNAGFLLADSECIGLAAQMHGNAAAHDLRDLGLRTRAIVAALAPHAQAHAGLSLPGSVRLASDRGEAAAFLRSEEMLGHAAGPRVRCAAANQPEGGATADRPGERTRPGSGPPWLAALVDEGDGVVDPLLVLDALIRAASRVRRFDATEVVAVVPRRGGGVTIETRVAANNASALLDGHAPSSTARASGVRAQNGRVHAERVIVCTNPDAHRLVPEALPRIRPVRAQALAAIVDPTPLWVRPAYANRGGEYWRLLPDGRALLGGLRRLHRRAENTANAAPNPAIHRELEHFLARIGRRADALSAPRIRITHRWAGIMGFTADGLPVAGPVPGRPGVHILAGFNGHGMGWAPGLAALLAATLEPAPPSAPSLSSPVARTRPVAPTVPAARTVPASRAPRASPTPKRRIATAQTVTTTKSFGATISTALASTASIPRSFLPR